MNNQTMMKPVLVYVCETWTLSLSHKHIHTMMKDWTNTEIFYMYGGDIIENEIRRTHYKYELYLFTT